MFWRRRYWLELPVAASVTSLPVRKFKYELPYTHTSNRPSRLKHARPRKPRIMSARRRIATCSWQRLRWAFNHGISCVNFNHNSIPYPTIHTKSTISSTIYHFTAFEAFYASHDTKFTLSTVNFSGLSAGLGRH